MLLYFIALKDINQIDNDINYNKQYLLSNTMSWPCAEHFNYSLFQSSRPCGEGIAFVHLHGGD